MANDAIQNPNDPFSSIGGGVQLPTGEWVPRGTTADPWRGVGSEAVAAAGGAYAAPGASPAAGPAQSTIPGQAGAASTYSATPGAAPSPYTSNQGSQDVFRNQLLAKASQGTNVDTQDPQFRQQADSYHAQVDREKRNYIADQAEKLGPHQTGALQGEERLVSERAGQAKGAFESELVSRELQNRRNEILQYTTMLGGLISDEERMMLQRELADLDAALRREGLAQTGSLGGRELDIRDRLGTGQLNLGMLSTLLNNQQFGQDLGFRIGATEANLNQDSLRYLLGF